MTAGSCVGGVSVRGRWDEYWGGCKRAEWWLYDFGTLGVICPCVLMASGHYQVQHVVHVNCIHTLHSTHCSPSLRSCFWLSLVQLDPFGLIRLVPAVQLGPFGSIGSHVSFCFLFCVAVVCCCFALLWSASFPLLEVASW